VPFGYYTAGNPGASTQVGTMARQTDAHTNDKSRMLDNLEILPILMQFKNTDHLEMPLDNIDENAIASWIDDRILDFVKTYLALHEDQHYLTYLKEYTVEDPIANVRFPKYAAAATCEWNRKTYYFIGEETCQEFRQKNGIST
jgi:YHS domain-containing protein